MLDRACRENRSARVTVKGVPTSRIGMNGWKGLSAELKKEGSMYSDPAHLIGTVFLHAPLIDRECLASAAFQVAKFRYSSKVA